MAIIAAHKLPAKKKSQSFFLKNKLILFLSFLFIFENLLFFGHLSSTSKKYSRVLSSTAESGSCPLACQELIDQKINLALASLSKTSNNSTTKTSINYLPLGSSGSTTSNTWTTIPGSGFSFNLKDYPKNARVYWAGNLKAQSGNSRCYARIYDTSNYRAVDFSEQSSSQIVFENLTSQPLTIWSGKNNYRLEIKSLNGIACFLESPKLIVKY